MATQFRVDITDEEQYAKEVLKGSTGNLHVLEVYQKWCGPTRAVVSTFKRYLLENPDAPVRFFTCCNETVQALSKFDKCEPSFLFIRDGKVAEEVIGVQLPRITRFIQQLSSNNTVAPQHNSSSDE
ncbi:hypothetical protein N2152v2_005003 [Parachlorella kessleri]